MKAKWGKATGDPKAAGQEIQVLSTVWHKVTSSCHASVSHSLELMENMELSWVFFFKQNQETCRELQTLRKKKNINCASEGLQSGCQQLIPWKTFNIIPGRCKYTYFFLQYVETTLHKKLLLWAQSCFPKRTALPSSSLLSIRSSFQSQAGPKIHFHTSQDLPWEWCLRNCPAWTQLPGTWPACPLLRSQINGACPGSSWSLPCLGWLLDWSLQDTLVKKTKHE